MTLLKNALVLAANRHLELTCNILWGTAVIGVIQMLQ